MIGFLKKASPYIFLAIIVLISYGRTLNMYWWLDDWGLVYKMIFPEDAPSPSNLGAGIFGEGAYRYLATPFIFLYPIFGLSTKVYFFLGLVQYYALTLLVYFFVKKIGSKNSLALIASSIFASGYIGSFAMYRLSNSYQLVGTGIFLILVAWSLYMHFIEKKKYFYWLSLIFFVALLEFFFLRAQGAIFAVLAVFLLVRKVNFSKVIPFAGLYYYFYFSNYRGGPESGGLASSGFLATLKQAVIDGGQWHLLTNLLITPTKVFIPAPLITDVHKWLFKGGVEIVSIDNLTLYAGLILLLLMLVTAFKKLVKGERVALLIPFGILWVLGNVTTYFLYNPYSNLDSNSRYLIPAFIGSAISLSAFFYLLKNKLLIVLLAFSLMMILIASGAREQKQIIKYVSIPDRQGYELLKRDAPIVDKDTIFFVDSIDDPNYKNNILGVVPQMAIPPLYGFRGIAKIAASHDELFQLLSEDETRFDNFHSYYYSENGYRVTTQDLKELLTGRNATTFLKFTKEPDGSLTIRPNLPNLVPNKLSLNVLAKSGGSVSSIDLRIWWMTDRKNVYYEPYSQVVSVPTDGRKYSYTVLIPAQGTVLREIKIDPPIDIEIFIDGAAIAPLNLKEIKELNRW